VKKILYIIEGEIYMYTRKDIVDFSVRMGCNRDLLNKGMVTNKNGDVFCVATLRGVYPDRIYYMNGIQSPKEALYCGVYGSRAPHRLYIGSYETRKNITLKETDGVERFIYFFERIYTSSKEYYFHGRYKYMDHEMVKSNNPEREEEILFRMLFVDRPDLV
jgi:hypothetical protein